MTYEISKCCVCGAFLDSSKAIHQLKDYKRIYYKLEIKLNRFKNNNPHGLLCERCFNDPGCLYKLDHGLSFVNTGIIPGLF